MRAECAETKVSAESKLAEAHTMAEDAQKKYAEAEAKFHAAELLQAEAGRDHRTAERKLLEVERREDDLKIRIKSFKSEYVMFSFEPFFFVNQDFEIGAYFPNCIVI